jgi:hypothetical protein
MANATMRTVTQSKESFPAGREAETPVTRPAPEPAPAPTETDRSTLDADTHDPYDNVACTD